MSGGTHNTPEAPSSRWHDRAIGEVLAALESSSRGLDEARAAERLREHGPNRLPEPPRRSVLALGYAGWDPGQLEDEIQANAWLVSDPDEAIVFDEDHASKWARALKKLGVTPEFLIGASGHA